MTRLKETKIIASIVNNSIVKQNSSLVTESTSLYELLKRSELSYASLIEIDTNRPQYHFSIFDQCETIIKYEGYINRQMLEVDRLKRLENKLLNPEIDYLSILGLRIEARQKLQKIKPSNIGQASRISGVSPADISVLLIYLEQERRKNAH